MTNEIVRALSLTLVGLLFAEGSATAREERTASDQLGPRFDLSGDATTASWPQRSYANMVEH